MRMRGAEVNHVAADIVIETSGGTVVAVYSADRDLRVVLVDWDEFKEDGRRGIAYPTNQMSEIPLDTRELATTVSTQ